MAIGTMSVPERPRGLVPSHQARADAIGADGSFPAIVIDAKLWNWQTMRQCFPAREGYLLVPGQPSAQALLFHSQRIAPCILVIDESSLDDLNPAEISAAADFGRSVRILVSGQRGDEESVQDLIRLGCMGFVPADAPPPVLRRAVRALARGEMWTDRRLLTRLLQDLLAARAQPKLTAREQEVLGLIASGCRNREIATRLSITHETVRWHIRGLNSKLGTHDRLEIALYGRQHFE